MALNPNNGLPTCRLPHHGQNSHKVCGIIKLPGIQAFRSPAASATFARRSTALLILYIPADADIIFPSVLG